MSLHGYVTTRTSPFGYYGECRCGWITHAYRETAREAFLDVSEHIRAQKLVGR
jgi:hypothetical protein